MTSRYSHAARRPLRIAIVEDEALVALETEMQLAGAGHEVVGTADTAEGAIRLGSRTRPDLALVDVRLADGSSGVDAARALGALGIVCLFATGNCPAEGEDHDDATGCLHKPYSQSDLLDAVDAAFAHAAGRPAGRVPQAMHLYN